MKAQRTFIIFAIFLAVSMLLASCSSPTPATTENENEVVQQTEEAEPVQATEAPQAATESPTAATEAPPASDEPVTLRVGWLRAIDCFNPNSCKYIWEWGDLSYDMFVGKGSDDYCTAVPTRLLDGWKMSEDGKTWTLTLADNITYSDGTPFNAQAAADFLTWFSTNPNLAVVLPTTSSFESVTVLDDKTLELKTKDPVPSFQTADGKYFYATPLHIWNDVPEDQLFTYDLYPPVGTGPYTVAEYEPGSRLILEARDDYFRGKPPIDKIIVQFYANADALTNALLAGEIDMTPPQMPPETYDILKADPNVTIFEQEAARKYEMNFNLSPKGKQHPAVLDPKLREAVDFAIDKQQLVDIALLGHGKVCPTNVACAPTAGNQINPDLTATPYDPQVANQLLDEAGYVDSDGDGVREMPDGTPLNFRLYYQVEEVAELTMAEVVSDFLKDIGVSTEIEALEIGEMNVAALEQRDYDLLIRNNYTDILAANNFKYNLSCLAADLGTVLSNFSGYCNPDMDNLMWGSFAALNEADYTDLLFQAEAILNKERPFITLAGINKIQAYRSDRFEFPQQICFEPEAGLMSFEGVMNAKAK